MGRCDDPWDAGERWRYRTGSRAYAPTVDDGVVYFGGQGAALYALDAADGTVRWRREQEFRIYRRAVVEGGTVIAPGYEALHAYDAGGGDAVWSFAPPGDHVEITDGPCVGAGRAYCLARNQSGPEEEPPETPYSRLYAVDLDGGQTDWYREFDTTSSLAMTVGPGDGVTLTASGGELLWLDAATGETRWRHVFDDDLGGPVTSGDGVAFPLLSGGIAAVDPTAERVRWRRDGPFGTYLAASEEAVYTVRRRELVALDAASGGVKWRTGLASEMEADPHLSVADGAVYYTVTGEERATKVAVDAARGCRLGRFEVPARSASRAAVAEDTVYFGGLHGDGGMYAVSAPPRHET